MDYAKPEVDCGFPTYLMQRRPFLACLVFLNEKACVFVSEHPKNRLFIMAVKFLGKVWA